MPDRILLEDERGEPRRTMRGTPDAATVRRVTQRSRLFDAAIVLVVGGMTEWLAWGHGGPGDHIEGPQWLTALLPLLLALPLSWRRTYPLAAWSLVAAGIVLQSLAAYSAEGLEMIGAFGVGMYSVGRYGSRRNAILGLAVFGVTELVYSANDPNTTSGRDGDQWASAFFVLLFLGCWIAGSYLRSREESERNALRAQALEHHAELAVTAERTRVARELHDIVSHNLSVVVLQAAGARAQPDRGSDEVEETLEKIVSSGREALVEMRRMLDVLRAEDEEASLSPQPGLDRVESLVEGVRRAGLDVSLDMEADCSDVPPAVASSAYRIVQEALTNTLKYAGPARAHVVVRREPDAVALEISDDGPGGPDVSDQHGLGHGLIGMRERAALLGGTLHAARRPGGGFIVQARLPLGESVT
jgi:signal transduction histidine kinase